MMVGISGCVGLRKRCTRDAITWHGTLSTGVCVWSLSMLLGLLVSAPHLSVGVATRGFDYHRIYLWCEDHGSCWLMSARQFGRRWSHSWSSSIRGLCPRIGKIVAHRCHVVASTSTVAGSDRHGSQRWLCHGIEVRYMRLRCVCGWHFCMWVVEGVLWRWCENLVGDLTTLDNDGTFRHYIVSLSRGAIMALNSHYVYWSPCENLASMKRAGLVPFVVFLLGDITLEDHLHTRSSDRFMQSQPLRWSSFDFVQDILCLVFTRARQSFMGEATMLKFYSKFGWWSQIRIGT